MAIFNQPTAPKKETVPPPRDPITMTPASPESALKRDPDPNEFSYNPNPVSAPASVAQPARAAAAEPQGKESLIASDLTIEGKIEGAGHIRIAGRFKGDVNVQGDLTIEVGAKLNGGVRARKVIIAGELEGNIEAAQRVELLEGGALIGDVKAGVVIVAAGSRMRGQVEFGWEDREVPRSGKTENGASS